MAESGNLRLAPPTKYSWWSQSHEPPEQFQTKKQLGGLHLSPLLTWLVNTQRLFLPPTL